MKDVDVGVGCRVELLYNDGVVLRNHGGEGSRCICVWDDNQDVRSALIILGRGGA